MKMMTMNEQINKHGTSNIAALSKCLGFYVDYANLVVFFFPRVKSRL